MSFFRSVAVIATFISISTVSAHGTVSGIVADGVYYLGYNPSFQSGQRFRPTTSYTGPDIICHKLATLGGGEAPIKGGAKLEFQWTPWPTSHHGPVLDYMGNCNGPCETVNKTTLKWFKIDQKGLLSGGNPGTWATDILIANNNSWTVTIPPTLKTGNYVIRHEIIALHAAGAPGGAQCYPFCFNLAITGAGTAAPSGISAETFYTPSDPGILVNIYQTLSTYIFPGPTVWSGGVTMSQTLPAAPTSTGVGIHTVK